MHFNLNENIFLSKTQKPNCIHCGSLSRSYKGIVMSFIEENN
jgi:hypothetical protein